MMLSKAGISKRAFSMVVLATSVLGCANGKADDLQSTIHTLVDCNQFIQHSHSYREQAEATQKKLLEYSQSQLVDALIDDLDVNPGSLRADNGRSLAVQRLFQSLRLPPTAVCKALLNSDSPQRKNALMWVLQGFHKNQEVTRALLQQINDRRVAESLEGVVWEFYKISPLRVRDVAYNSLIITLDLSDQPKIGPATGGRDKIIRATLEKLKLEVP